MTTNSVIIGSVASKRYLQNAKEIDWGQETPSGFVFGVSLCNIFPEAANLDNDIDDGADTPYDYQAEADLAAHDPLVHRYRNQQKDEGDEDCHCRNQERSANVDMIRLVLDRSVWVLRVPLVGRLRRHPGSADADSEENVQHGAAKASRTATRH